MVDVTVATGLKYSALGITQLGFQEITFPKNAFEHLEIAIMAVEIAINSHRVPCKEMN